MATPKHPVKDSKKSASTADEASLNSSEAKIKAQPQSQSAKRQTISFVVFLLAWVLVAMTASQLVIGVIMVALLQDNFNQPFWIFIYYGLTYVVSLLLVLYIPPRLYSLFTQHFLQKKTQNRTTNHSNPLKLNPEELGMQHAPTFVDIGLAPIGYVVYIALSMLFTTIMSVFTWFNANEAQDVGFSYYLTGSNRIIAMIALVFIAPIAEEIIMRGWLYGKLRSRLPLPLAIVLTSILFGFLHGQWNVGVGVFALSLVLCSLREITGTIWSGILLHILSNGIAFYLLYIGGV